MTLRNINHKEKTLDKDSRRMVGTFPFLGNNYSKRQKWMYFKTSIRTLDINSLSK